MKHFSLKRLLKQLTGFSKETLDVFTRPRVTPAEQMTNLCRAILDLKGEAAAVVIAEELQNLYQDSEPAQRLEFLKMLASEFSPDGEAVARAIATYQQDPSQQNVMALNAATESPRQELFRTLNMAPEATAALIGFRENLLNALPDHPELKVIDQDLLHLFRSWFNRGFLELRRIDWQTPALILEKLIEYESVHEIKGWDDLRRRLRHDRRCFGFFHPVIPHIPLIFVEVALTREVSSNISELLQQPVPEEHDESPNCAIFYSINNCLDGLRGVSFGNLLIKQVVASLAAEFPKLSSYATLSPIPGFTRWLEKNLDTLEILDDEEKELLPALQASPATLTDDKKARELGLKLCSHYLVNAKSRGKPANAVARFHLGNGARLERINWAADLSENGLRQSLGMMVNYLYDRSEIATNHEAYELRDEVRYGSEVRKWLVQTPQTGNRENRQHTEPKPVPKTAPKILPDDTQQSPAVKETVPASATGTEQAS